MEIPSRGRATIDENFDGMEITIPAKKNFFIIPFLGVWLCFWLVAEIFVLSMLVGGSVGGPPGIFLFVWLCGWTAGGIFAFRAFWWNVAGKEVILIAQGAITLDKKGALFYKAKTYDLRESKNFRAQEDNIAYGPFGNMSMFNLFNLKNSGTIRFDYGLETIKFANGIHEAEANFIILKLKDKKYIS
jgi:hypothetical protein